MSNDARRMSVRRSASGWSVRPRVASLPLTIVSIAPAPAETAASFGFIGDTNAQCGSYVAPSAIHRSSVSTCSSKSRPILACGGGMTASGSSETIRATSSLSSIFSGTIARAPLSSSSIATSGISSRSPACRLPLSGPWQAKQLSERIGRMSRLNDSRGFGPAGSTAAPNPGSGTTAAAITITKPRTHAMLHHM